MCLMGSMPKLPEIKPPAPLPQPPKPRDAAVTEAGRRERRRAGLSTDTILSGPRGATSSAATTGASVLSGTR